MLGNILVWKQFENKGENNDLINMKEKKDG